MSIEKKIRWAGAAAFIACGLVAAPSSAYVSRLAHSGCVQDWGSTYAFFSGGNNLTANTLILNCAVTDTTDISHPSMTAINVHGDDNTSSGSVWAFRCVSYWNAVGGLCGNTVTSPNGAFGIAVPNTPSSFATQWNNGSHFASLGIYLPPKTAGGALSTIKGYFMAN
jgi:hypothetical protein